MARRHHIGPEPVHSRFDRSLPPALTVDSGDEVVITCLSGNGDQLQPGDTAAALGRVDRSRIHSLTGPVAVRDAQPGSVLQVDILALTTGEFGFTQVVPGLGLLPDDFPEPALHFWDLRAGDYAEFKPGIRVPIQPFLGVMGVALSAPGAHKTLPPRQNGGNIDIRHLTVGSTLFLPVWVEGGLFSCGDGHAAQGDGEVCVTAIETAMQARLRFTVRSDLQMAEPRFIAPGPLGRPGDDLGHYVTTACGPDIYANSRQAIRYMIDHLVADYHLTRVEAYMLCSVAVDLKISEIVDAPNWLVSAYLPLSLFA